MKFMFESKIGNVFFLIAFITFMISTRFLAPVEVPTKLISCGVVHLQEGDHYYSCAQENEYGATEFSVSYGEYQYNLTRLGDTYTEVIDNPTFPGLIGIGFGFTLGWLMSVLIFAPRRRAYAIDCSCE